MEGIQQFPETKHQLSVSGLPPLQATVNHPVPEPLPVTVFEDLPAANSADGLSIVKRKGQSKRDKSRKSKRFRSSLLSHSSPPSGDKEINIAGGILETAGPVQTSCEPEGLPLIDDKEMEDNRIVNNFPQPQSTGFVAKMRNAFEAGNNFTELQSSCESAALKSSIDINGLPSTHETSQESESSCENTAEEKIEDDNGNNVTKLQSARETEAGNSCHKTNSTDQASQEPEDSFENEGKMEDSGNDNNNNFTQLQSTEFVTRMRNALEAGEVRYILCFYYVVSF